MRSELIIGRGSAALLATTLACAVVESPLETDSTTDPGATTGGGATTGTPPTTTEPDSSGGDAVCVTDSAVATGFSLDLGDWPAVDGAYEFDAPCMTVEAVQEPNAASLSFVFACTDATDTPRMVSLVITGDPAPSSVYNVDTGLEVVLKVRRPAGVGDDGGSFAVHYGGEIAVAGTNGPVVGDPALFVPFTVTAMPQGCSPAAVDGCAAGQTFDLVIDGGPFEDSHFGHGHVGVEGSQVYLFVAIERALQVTSEDPAACPLEPEAADTFRFMLTYSPI